MIELKIVSLGAKNNNSLNGSLNKRHELNLNSIKLRVLMTGEYITNSNDW